MEIIGIIKKIYPIQEGVSKSTGNPWKSMEFLLETEDRYPQSVCLLLMNDNCTRFEIKEGDKIKVSFDMKAREWENKAYNTLIAWKVDKI
ncbi:DUF3127 domain-containing protein [Phocaeicola coprocola]|uniref:DUF3127 domain-containing protein n=1 Tax=Phocaeicola coprocola TaxID=310298 RepID=UPI001956793C|nr:DUF3127 domain-containing protein [Phocaeicola coprocola]MBM6714697.1 DUF3127 domain-containing protein [Phocaeicola coprocola]